MRQRLAHSFVSNIPETVSEGRLYISMEYATAVHKCCCGCGQEVVTPFSPSDWKLIYDGASISLAPSIGNWSFDCQSHYWIQNSTVRWAPKWSKEKIEAGRAQDRLAKGIEKPARNEPSKGVFQQATSWIKRWFP